MRIGIITGEAGTASAIRRVLSREPKHSLVWLANDTDEALRLCAQDVPDLVLLDLFVPQAGAVEATRHIMAATPCAILLVAGDVGRYASDIFDAMGHGALDAIDVPQPEALDAGSREVRFLAKIESIDRRWGVRNVLAPRRVSSAVVPQTASSLVAIGASAGGPAAVRTVLSGLPRDLPAAVVVVQHMDQRFAAGMVDWLSEHSDLPIRLSQEGDVPVAGVVLLANTNDHLILKSGRRLGYTAHPDDYVYRPSVDIFFQSVCNLWTGRAVGVLLTGMGRDGAIGLKALRDKGHHTIAQDQASSAVYGMPKAAIEDGAAVEVADVSDIAAQVSRALSRNPS